MHTFQPTLYFACTLTLLAHMLSTSSVNAYPLARMYEARTSLSESSGSIAKRSPDDYDQDEQIAVFADGEGDDRQFIWSKYSYARMILGAGHPTKEIESMTLNLDNL